MGNKQKMEEYGTHKEMHWGSLGHVQRRYTERDGVSGYEPMCEVGKGLEKDRKEKMEGYGYRTNMRKALKCPLLKDMKYSGRNDKDKRHDQLREDLYDT